ncbi:VWA domain-containing protein [Bacillus sp. FJAT-42376]|uniref:vWA domain-containing protein n=1 Tax=Bacillus sp. FJAT-42376 TaxID=2014076 RepID=UPI000F4E8418|nr:VWA domain-containing protein [Bacillus sp. FJAT-42376]AZB43177.1 VWA domain-containing protein [Bacillus sp. FJAT-42376]
MRFIKFNDSQIDSFLFMELSDLAKTLSKNPDLELEYAPYSYLNPAENKIYLTHFWDHRPLADQISGLKSDVYLTASGQVFHSSRKETKQFIDQAKKLQAGGFAKQLFVLLESVRIEEIIKKERPGTKKYFNRRTAMYRKYFRSQLTIHLERNIAADALFNALYLKLTAESPLETIPLLNKDFERMLPFLQRELEMAFESSGTAQTAGTALRITETAEEFFEKDMLNTYFFLPENGFEEADGLTFKDLKRTNKLDNDDTLDLDRKEERDVHDQEMPTWHRETSKATDSFLQYDLEHGSKTDLMGNGLREGEDGDQAMGTVQGSARESKRNNYAESDVLENRQDGEFLGREHPFGKENKYAYPVFKEPETIAPEHYQQYSENKAIISHYQKKLKQMIKKTLEHKKTNPRTDLHTGRLGRKLLRWVTDDNPRLFYKKQEPSMQIDAVFTLLVDCSASMHDKMDDTKLGITLFHEALKSVGVVHQVTGFWEDTNEASALSQPNYFHRVIPFRHSLSKSSGPTIMQLSPEEDNRDGYAIRHMTKELVSRQEKQKFLLVFSDGEPAAMDYEQKGIVDTHEAVLEARKRGIEVINIFLSSGEAEESQIKTIQNIYGKFSIIVPDVSALPDVLFPLLRKLLKKSILSI